MAKANHSTTMRHYIVFSLALAFSAFTVPDGTAQGTKPDTTFHPHWEIGVDLLPLIDKETAPANTLFARRNYFLEKGRGKAWRWRAGVEIFSRRYTDVGHWTPSKFDSYGPYLSFGHEWQYHNLMLRNSFRWIVGTEVGVSYFRNHQFYLVSLADSLREKGLTTELNLLTTGILGFQVRLAPSLYFSSEASIIASYNRHRYVGDLIYQDFPESHGHSDTVEKFLKFQVHPMYVVNLIYSLKFRNNESEKN